MKAEKSRFVALRSIAFSASLVVAVVLSGCGAPDTAEFPSENTKLTFDPECLSLRSLAGSRKWVEISGGTWPYEVDKEYPRALNLYFDYSERVLVMVNDVAFFISGQYVVIEDANGNKGSFLVVADFSCEDYWGWQTVPE